MVQSQYDQIHRIAELARELCVKRNRAAMELLDTYESAQNNLVDLVGELGGHYTFKKLKLWDNHWFTGCGIAKDDNGRDCLMFYPQHTRTNAFSYDHEILFILSVTDHIIRELGEP